MAEVRWTESQKSAIEAADKNILVSAAAGSGKTAVLVERVLRRVLDPEDPVSIDSFVIITFTKAAASQMREKIRKDLSKALKADPENQRIKEQLLSVHAARICTIDALCLEIVKENFHGVDIDPAFRTAAKEEADIIRKNILEEVIEENYASKARDGSKEAFIELVESYIGKDDRKIEELIKSIYAFAQSDAEPYAWMDRSIAVYEDAADMGASEGEVPACWDYLKTHIREALQDVADQAQAGYTLTISSGGPAKYAEIFENYEEVCTRIVKELEKGEAMFSRIKEEMELLIDYRAPRYTEKSMEKEGVDPAIKDAAKEIMDSCKEIIKKDIIGKFLFQSMEEHYRDLSECCSAAETLIRITGEFARRFEEEKRRRLIAEFSDISHYALKVLIRHDENGYMIRDEKGEPVYTETADELAGGISEIIVDEYQDTNMLQEYMINALSSRRFGRPNVFMVGDMKQSIYRFRMAVPRLFTEKYDAYAKSEGCQRIILENNFRSRPEILRFTNFIFEQIMTKASGDIDYLDGNGLRPSPAYEKEPPSDVILPEVYVIEGKSQEGRRCEARLVAKRISEMVGKEEIEEEGIRRKIRYSDIAILAMKNDAFEMEQELSDRKIPQIKSSNKGFFDCYEVSLLMDLLRIVDNPYQDIPFTAVLRSPIAGLNANALAGLKIGFEEQPFSMYKAALAYRNRRDCPQTFSDFMDRLETYRQESLYMGVSEFTDHVAEDCGLYDLVTAMPEGEIRRANIDLFINMTASYEKNGESGLFNLLRYFDELRKQGYERGEAQGPGNSDAVQIMTMHKSKGLEFPVVFIINTGSRYNEDDLRRNIVPDRDLGIGVELRKRDSRIRKDTIVKNLIGAKIKKESRAEEMRLLYVALTRAKTKLIVTGTVTNTEKFSGQTYREGTAMPKNTEVLDCSSHIGLIMLALRKIHTGICDVNVLTPKDIYEARVEEIQETSDLRKKLDAFMEAVPEENVILKNSYEYPYKAATQMPVKITASGLEKHEKKVEPSETEEKSDRYGISEEGDVTPAQRAGASGAVRGNAYHRFFELLDYKGLAIGIEKMIDNAVVNGLLSPEEAALIEPSKIRAFLETELGRRMKAAAEAGVLKREQPYIMGIEKDGELQLVQGIIDTFFEEDGKIVLVDYKTDRKKREADFTETYKGQIEAYAAAIEKALNKPVKEKLLYSVELEKTIRIGETK